MKRATRASYARRSRSVVVVASGRSGAGSVPAGAAAAAAAAAASTRRLKEIKKMRDEAKRDIAGRLDLARAHGAGGREEGGKGGAGRAERELAHTKPRQATQAVAGRPMRRCRGVHTQKPQKGLAAASTHSRAGGAASGVGEGAGRGSAAERQRRARDGATGAPPRASPYRSRRRSGQAQPTTRKRGGGERGGPAGGLGENEAAYLTHSLNFILVQSATRRRFDSFRLRVFLRRRRKKIFTMAKTKKYLSSPRASLRFASWETRRS